MAKCRIDSFRLRETGSMCHMFLLNVEFVNACRFRVFSVTFRSRVFHSRVFSHPSVDTDEQSSWKLPAFLPNIQNVVTNSSCWQCMYALISLLYKQLLKSVEIFHCTIRCVNRICKEVLYETFSTSFHFHKIVHENTFSRAFVFHLSINGYCKTRPHRSYCFLSMLKIHCKRHYRNLAAYSWCTTWREHFTKTAPARRRHSVGGGGAAAAHSSMSK